MERCSNCREFIYASSYYGKEERCRFCNTEAPWATRKRISSLEERVKELENIVSRQR